MAIVDADVADWQIAEAWLDRITESASVLLSRSVTPDVACVPDQFKPMIVDVHGRLRGIVQALFTLQTSCEDMASFRTIAEAGPAQGENIGSYQQLNFLHCHLTYLWDSFDDAMQRFSNCYNETLEVLSADESQIDITELLHCAGAQNAESADGTAWKPEQLYAVAPSSTELPFLNTLRIASRWPKDWPEFVVFSDRAWNELMREATSRSNEMQAISTRLVLAHGPALQELISRHNVMMRNFKLQRNLEDRH